MKRKPSNKTLANYFKISQAAAASEDGKRCMIAPHPKLKEKIKKEIKRLKASAKSAGLAPKIKVEETTHPGFNDGLIYPGNTMPLGTSLREAISASRQKAPLRGVVRVVVVLVDFSDKPMTKTKKDFENLFFSKGVVPTGSVNEYYKEVTNNLIDIQGEVVGPFRLPKKLKTYANGVSGTGDAAPNARTMARDAAILANPSINFSLYDNNKDGYVDAFVLVHAGTGAETNNNPNDIWSHKWVLEGDPYTADGSTKIYSYLTVPEDCKLGVCAHELGHLLFGFPDLYDIDYSSEGIGDWCLMAGGSWNNDGLTPAHPSAWCKCDQGWVNITTPVSNKTNVSIDDVKTSYNIYKLWKNGTAGKEYFLVENRQKKKFDKFLPAAGLLVWHIDESMESNENEKHYKVALVQADGKKDLEGGNNRGDGGDVFPGIAKKKNFDASSTPDSKSYGGVDSKVALNNIKLTGGIVKVDIKVK